MTSSPLPVSAAGGPAVARPAATVACHHTISGVGLSDPARFSFAERVTAARAAGLDGIGLTWQDYERLRSGGQDGPTLRAIADDAGVRVVEVEFLNSWWADGERGAQAVEQERLALEMADVFGARHLGVGASVPAADAPPHEVLVERFAGLCDRAAEHGLRVGLEFMPFFVLSDARRAWRVVADAGHAAGGLTVDAFHVGRGATDLAMLAEIPPERIVAFQLSDVVADPRWPVLTETLEHRQWPGDGVLDLAGLAAVVLRPGADVAVEVEVLNAEHRRAPVADSNARAARGLRDVVAAAGQRAV